MLPVIFKVNIFELNLHYDMLLLGNRARRRASQQVLTKVQLKLVMIVNHHAVEWFITACIVLNTILLASEHHMQPDWLGRLISFGSHVSTYAMTNINNSLTFVEDTIIILKYLTFRVLLLCIQLKLF